MGGPVAIALCQLDLVIAELNHERAGRGERFDLTEPRMYRPLPGRPARIARTVRVVTATENEVRCRGDQFLDDPFDSVAARVASIGDARVGHEGESDSSIARRERREERSRRAVELPVGFDPRLVGNLPA